MTKELSKQLCELCGIEPRVGICDRELNPDDYSGECGFFEPTEYECNDCANFNHDLISYPDFGQPENFVKLIELKPFKTHKPLFGEVTALTYFFNRTAFILNCREDFLRMLLNTLNGYSDDFIPKSSQEKINPRGRVGV